MALITFISSTFSGLELSEVIFASIEISGGIVSSKDINITIMFTDETTLSLEGLFNIINGHSLLQY